MKKNELFTGKIVETKQTYIIIRYAGKDFKIMGYFPKAVIGTQIRLIEKNQDGFHYFVPTLTSFEEMGGQTFVAKAKIVAKKRGFCLLRFENGQPFFWNRSKGIPSKGQNINVLTASFYGINHAYLVEL